MDQKRFPTMYARDQSKYNTLHRLDVILDVLGYTERSRSAGKHVEIEITGGGLIRVLMPNRRSPTLPER